MKKIIFILCAMGLFTYLFGQDKAAFEKRSYVDANGDTLHYRILYPPKYNKNKKYPLVLFLHGAGERGYDNEAQLTHGSSLFLNAENRRKYPAIVVFPQCKPAPDYWAHMVVNEQNGVRYREFPVMAAPKPSMKRVMELLAKLQNEEAIDQNRLYLMGLSMGGMGTFELLSRMPNTFAAAIPICGGGNVTQVEKYAKTTPLWIFHGDKDDVVLPEYSRQMYAALQAAGANVQYTEFPGVNHNSWDPTFKQKGLLKWLFSNKLNK
ncbi:MAG: prolyl oligopeptidase family serine peptidase [Saprospiraceae bacterium]